MDTPKLTAETKGLCLGGTHRIDVVECQSSYHLVLALGNAAKTHLYCFTTEKSDVQKP